MDTVKKAVASANDAVASAAQSAKETLTGVQHQVGAKLVAISQSVHACWPGKPYAAGLAARTCFRLS